mmetsp:Transcript_44281/g.117164  ORF Transcript_44281/g.117164 Transcript_44281/m.117164 type:complete len:263 (-) Transcript_44281:924-1712(-)
MSLRPRCALGSSHLSPQSFSGIGGMPPLPLPFPPRLRLRPPRPRLPLPSSSICLRFSASLFLSHSTHCSSVQPESGFEAIFSAAHFFQSSSVYSLGGSGRRDPRRSFSAAHFFFSSSFCLRCSFHCSKVQPESGFSATFCAAHLSHSSSVYSRWAPPQRPSRRSPPPRSPRSPPARPAWPAWPASSKRRSRSPKRRAPRLRSRLRRLSPPRRLRLRRPPPPPPPPPAPSWKNLSTAASADQLDFSRSSLALCSDTLVTLITV